MGIITGQNTITGWHCLFVVLLYTMARTSGDTRYACDNETYSSGGMCEDDSNLTYVCCDPDTEINECESLPCANNATCNDTINGFTCTCMDGFEGQLCQFQINECESLPCANNATCNDAINGFTCTCMDGFEGQLCQFHERRATFFEVFIPHVLWLTALIISNLITAGVIWAIWARRNANRPT
ncbi:uncharacterized protein [Apostichopus japonicus]|uniref:uncharacterized protein isoform X1 n=1 Tax=Stichopus japonicus TaxID=307972 RepID=UPI003AB4B5A7